MDQQITLLELKREHIENLIDLARGIKLIGVKKLDFTAFDTTKLDEYAREAKASWGQTEAYREFEEKSKDWGKEDMARINTGLMAVFAGFGSMREKDPSGPAAQSQVEKLRSYITENFYTCTPEILKGLGDMYSGGGSMQETIDRTAGEGAAEFASRAIDVYCRERAKGERD